MSELGAVELLGIDRAQGRDWPALRELQAIAECPRCGLAVNLWAETVEWAERDDGTWKHSAYGPASGNCCGLLIVSTHKGTEVYALEDAPA